EDRRPAGDVPVGHLHHQRQPGGHPRPGHPLWLHEDGAADRPAGPGAAVRRGEDAARGPDVRAGDRLAHPASAAVRGGVLMATVPERKGRVKRMTAERFLAGPPDEFKTELIYGEVVVCPRPTDMHQDLLHDLGELLRRWTRSEDLGKLSFDIDMVLDEL